jgi:hypothetical protein
MPHSFTSLLVHIIFSTKNRARDLTPDLAARLFPYMAGIIRERKGVPVIVNGPEDHVHLLVHVPATEPVPTACAVGYDLSPRSGACHPTRRFPRLAPWATIFRPVPGLAIQHAGSHGLRRGLRSFAPFRGLPSNTPVPTACAVGYDLSPSGLRERTN